LEQVVFWGQSSGFPDASGNPPGTITINNHPGTFGSKPSVKWLGTIIAHEMGHCIGFRHTDYKNRAYSCGGFKVNEGRAGVGAVWIPGTPTGPKDPNSWMLACTDGSNRPFNPNDLMRLIIFITKQSLNKNKIRSPLLRRAFLLCVEIIIRLFFSHTFEYY
jgi:hypothetical protein